MIYLITATPGSGKTLWAVNEIFKRVNEPEPWNIFSNIDGLKLDTAEPLKEKFTDYPPRSLVIIDEAQQITHFSKKYKHPVRNENHPEVEFLQVHRHADHLDIIFITQAPRLLNPDVLDMVGTHYHLHRAMGMKMATWWLWKHHQLNPNTKSAKSDAEDSGTFTYPKQLFGMYKSSVGGGDSHGKIKIPLKIINAIWMLLLVLGVSFWLYVKQSPSQTTDLTEKEEKTLKTELPEKAIPDPDSISISFDPNVECRNAVNLDTPVCVHWFNNLTMKRGSVHTDLSGSVQVTYDPSKPYDLEHVQSSVRYEATAKPVFSGCIKKDGQYFAYTQQGTILQASNSDCRRLIDHGDRPFNYFKDPESYSVQSVPTDTEDKKTNEVPL